MDDFFQDCYVVFLRNETNALERPEKAEQSFATCPSYEEAARIAQQIRLSGKQCIIRSVGQSGVVD